MSLALILSTALMLAGDSGGGGVAQLYAYRLTDPAAFAEGYRRHLAWHEAKGDVLVWYGWHVIDGERAGAFVDGTFGTTPEALAARPDLEGDAADFRATAGPFARRLGDERWALWPDVSRASTLEDRSPGRAIRAEVYMALDAPAFEEALAARPLPGVAWYKRPGPGLPVYLAIGPAGEPQAGRAPEVLLAAHAASAHARVIRAETWRYDPALSLLPRSGD